MHTRVLRLLARRVAHAEERAMYFLVPVYEMDETGYVAQGGHRVRIARTTFNVLAGWDAAHSFEQGNDEHKWYSVVVNAT